MEKKYEMHYHVKDDGSAEVLCELLNCFEQPCYFKYKNVSDRNPWIFFCGNINLYFDIEELKFGVKNCEVREEYCDIQTFTLTEHFNTKITELLYEYGEIILTTAFNYVCDYVWYKDVGRNGIHTQHCSYLLGENETEYFIADNPYVLLDAEKLKWESNNSIFTIPKSHFMEAFEKCCIATVIRYKNIPKTRERELAYFMAICREISRGYQAGSNTDKMPLGRQAFLCLKTEFERGNENVMEDFFVFHMIIARRVIFNRCINIFKEYMYDGNKINSLLKKSIEYWKTMKELAFEHHYYDKKVCMLAAKKMEDIIEIEDALADEISNIQWKLFS